MSYLKHSTNNKRKSTDRKPILNELYNCGYNRETICKTLEISKVSFNQYFNRPENFKYYQLQRIAFLLCKSVYYVESVLYGINPGSPHWTGEMVDGYVMEATHEYKANKTAQ